MKRTILTLLAALCIISTFACAPIEENANGNEIVDDLGNSVCLSFAPRVAAGYASFGECWQLAGGSLVGITADALEDGRIEGADKMSLIGSVKELDLERLVALNPDYLLLSADIAAHVSLDEKLSSLGIPHGYFRVDTFSDYSSLMSRFCSLTGRTDLYEENVKSVEDRINSILAKIPENETRSLLLMRAYSTGIKAKKDDNLAGRILSELGLKNIADESPSLLENMSVEHIIREDPDFIFVLTMGSEDSARAYLQKNIESDPAWAELTAIKNGAYAILPKDLFHYKPNNRWDESYEYLAKLIYPEIFS